MEQDQSIVERIKVELPEDHVEIDSENVKGSLRRQRKDEELEEEELVEDDEPRSKIFRGSHDDGPSTSVKQEELKPSEAEPSEIESDAVPMRRGAEIFEIVHTRPSDMINKRGISGEKITLQANYYRLQTASSWKIYQYHLKFEPPIESRRLRGGILSEHRTSLGNGYLYDGVRFFTSLKLKNEPTILHSTSKDNVEYAVTLRFVGIIKMSQWQSLQILNLILKRAMEGLSLQMVGRNFFDALAKIDIREFRLQLWPGYQTSIRQHERDKLLCADIAYKVMRTETLYDILLKFKEKGRDFQDQYRRAVAGATVLTDYNNQTYRISDVDFKRSPLETFTRKKKQVSFVDYYHQKHNIRIKDPNQPLLISKAKARNVRVGESEIVILIPELCRATGLTDQMRTNFPLMRALSNHTRMNPDRRMDRLRKFNQRLHMTPSSVSVLESWNMQLDKNPVEIEGRVLPTQQIYFHENKPESAGDTADWTRMCRDRGLFTVPSRGLHHWTAIGPNRIVRELHSFIDTLMRAGEELNLRVIRPKIMLLRDDRNHSYLQAIDDCSRDDPQFILCLVPNNNSERYAAIKKKSYLERGIPSQVLTLKSAGNHRSLMSIATKVAIQINCKLGYTPWMVHIPLGGLMTIGYDTCQSSRDKSKAFGALVASMDLQTNATFYSTVAECNSSDILANNLWPMMYKALQQYRREHNTLPSRILFYRDGVGEGTLRKVFEHEVKEIVEKLEIEYQKVGQTPKFAFIVVSKSPSARLFARGRNPPPGTVVDDVITLPESYDFFLVSQGIRTGSVSPTYYNVIFSKIGLSPDRLQMLTFKHTHLYFNWSGTIKVPAVCQYAKKLATLVATSLHQAPLHSLEKKLFYL